MRMVDTMQRRWRQTDPSQADVPAHRYLSQAQDDGDAARTMAANCTISCAGACQSLHGANYSMTARSISGAGIGGNGKWD
eukprot:gene33963-40017_t